MGSSFAVLALLAASELSHRFQQDLGAPLHPAISLIGGGVPGAVRNEGNALRVVFAGQSPNPSEVVVAPTFEVSGDFQITLDYEIVAAAEPKKGFGAGVKIWGELDDPRGKQALTMARLVRPRRGHEVVAVVNDKSLPSKEGVLTTPQAYPDLQGRLRLERTGAVVRFLTARSGEESFVEMFSSDVSEAPLKSLRFIATRHGEKDPLDVRLKTIEIRAADLPVVSTPREGAAWGFWIAVLTLVGVGAGVGAVVWRMRSRNQGNAR
jgi:hypothetical protein